MKIRLGHVSNSSSSSFIVVGYKVPREDIGKTDDEIYEFSRTRPDNHPIPNFVMYPGGDGVGCGDNEVLAGVLLSDSESLETYQEFSLDGLNKMSVVILEALESIGIRIDANHTEYGLYIGTRSC